MAGVHAGQLGGSTCRDGARRIRRAIEGLVVTHDGNSVGGQLDIEFQAIRTGGQTAVERRYRVFRTKGAAAPMREHPRATLPRKERHNAQCSMLNAPKGKSWT